MLVTISNDNKETVAQVVIGKIVDGPKAFVAIVQAIDALDSLPKPRAPRCDRGTKRTPATGAQP